jgi:hypothetical protein
LNPRPLPPGHDPGIPEMSIPPQAGPPEEQGVYQNEIVYKRKRRHYESTRRISFEP